MADKPPRKPGTPGSRFTGTIDSIPPGHGIATSDPAARRRLDNWKRNTSEEEQFRTMGPQDYLQNRDEPETVQYQHGGEVRPPQSGYSSKRDRTQGRPDDTMPADQRKLHDRINVNEMLQGREDMRRGGFGTSRDFMPGPPVSEPNVLLNPDEYSQGGRVKHGSSTVIRCRAKHE